MGNKKITPKDLDLISDKILSKGYVIDDTEIFDYTEGDKKKFYSNTVFIPEL